MKGLSILSLDLPWGLVTISRPIPRDGDAWGILSPLKETSWAPLIPEVSEELLNHALRGHTMPLERKLGLPPEELARRVPYSDGACRLLQAKACAMSKPFCKPGKKLPDCYEAPGASPEVSWAATLVGLAWRDGRYVIVFGEGEEEWG